MKSNIRIKFLIKNNHNAFDEIHTKMASILIENQTHFAASPIGSVPVNACAAPLNGTAPYQAPMAANKRVIFKKDSLGIEFVLLY